MSWVNHFHLDAKPCSFVGDECGELIERPAILGAVVFLGAGPTTCTCRALSDTFKGFYSDRCNTLRMGMVHHLAGYLMIDILHPAAFLVLGSLDGSLLVEALQLLAASIERAALVSHLSPIAIEPRGFACNVGDGWDLDARVHSHDDLTLLRLYVWQRRCCIGYPLLILPFDAENALLTNGQFPTTGDLDLSSSHAIPHGDDEHALASAFVVRSGLAHLKLPILVVPLSEGLFENGDTTKLKGSIVDALGIADHLILNGTWKRSGEVLGTQSLGEHVSIVSLHDNINAVDIFLAVFA